MHNQGPSLSFAEAALVAPETAWPKQHHHAGCALSSVLSPSQEALGTDSWDSPQGAPKTYSVFPRVQTKIPQLSAKRKSQPFFCFLKKINISRRRLCKRPGGKGGQEVAPTLPMNFLAPSRQFMVGIWGRGFMPVTPLGVPSLGCAVVS